jgi:hypothetical protein
MPKFRADFIVKCSVVFPDDVPFVLLSEDSAIETTLRDVPVDAQGHVPGLVAEVIGECASIEEAAPQFRELLAAQLDVISFATQSTFMIDRCFRVLDWEPFLATRRFLPMQKFDPLLPPNPDLQPEVLATVQSIIRAKPDEHVLRAMHSFRLGVIERELSDQFLRFWSALEVLAEATKEIERVAIQCPKCQSDLFCTDCQEAPKRRPMATQAIRALLNRIHPQGERIFRLFADTRNHLIHGGSINSLSAKTGVSLDRAVNEAALAAWHAIWSLMPRLEGQAQFNNREGNFAHRELVVSADMVFKYQGEGPHPSDAEIPKPQISMQVQFRPMADDQTDDHGA